MKYSVMNWIYGPEPFEKTLQRLLKFKYDGISIKGEPTDYDSIKVRELLKRYELEAASIDGMYPWPTDERDLASPIDNMRRRAIDYLNRCSDLAQAVNASLIVVVPSPIGKTKPLTTREKEWELAVESVREAGLYAQARNIEIAIEPINRYETHLVNNVGDALCFKRDVGLKNVKIMLDTFHMNIEEPDPAAAVRKAGKDLIHMHIADSNRQSVGRGHIDFKSILRSLKEIRYDRYLAMEPLPPLSDPYMALKGMISPESFDLYAEECIKNLKAIEKII